MIAKLLKFAKAILFAGAVVFSVVGVSKAVQVEGFDSNGDFRTVGVTKEGYLLVASISSGTATSVVFVSSQPVNAFQATTPWIEKDYTYATPSSFQSTCNSNSHIITTSSTRVSTLICNADSTNIAYVGPSGVTTSTGAAIFPKACFTPDTPGTFIGDLFCSAGSPITVTVYQGSP